MIPEMTGKPGINIFQRTDGTQCVTPDGYPYTTSYDTCPQPIATTAPQKAVRELPMTGVDPAATIALGIALVAAGTVLRRFR